MRKEELRTYIENHESEMIEDLKSLIRIPSEKQAAEPGKPFGAPAAEALAQGIEILEKYGFAVTNYDNYAIAADFNQEEKGLDILAHLDVVPAGEGWQETDPFTPLIKEGKMFGRGTADDKGPAIAAIYAMRAVKELGYPLKKNVRLVLGSDEECGSSDLEYYYKKEVEAPCTFSPDAEFPVINIEKGGMRGHFEKTSDAGTTGVRLVSLQAGTKLNVVPGKAYAELAGMAKEDLKTCADETEQKTGVSFVLEDTENGNVKITACGAFAHASTPEMGNNALTALLQLLASVGMEESELKNDISFLAKVYPHGDGKGAGLGVAMSDEESGELTLSLDLMNYDGKTFLRLPRPDLRDKRKPVRYRRAEHEKRRLLHGRQRNVPTTPRPGRQPVCPEPAAVLHGCHWKTRQTICDRRRNVCASSEKRCCVWMRRP